MGFLCKNEKNGEWCEEKFGKKGKVGYKTFVSNLKKRKKWKNEA